MAANKRKSLFTGSLLVSLSTLLGAGFSFLTQWMLARYYSVESFGAFSVSWAMVQAMVPLATLGVAQFLIQRYKVDQKSAFYWLKYSFQWLVCLTGLSVSLYLVWVFNVEQTALARNVSLVFLFWLVAVIPVVVVYARYQIEHDTSQLSMWPLWQIIPRTLVVGLIVFLDLPIWVAAVGFLIVILPLSWLSIKTFAGMARPLSIRDESLKEGAVLVPSLKSTIVGSWSFGASEWLDKLDIRIIVPTVAFFADEAAAGQFAVAAMLLMFIYFVPSAVLQRYLLPHFYSWLVNDHAKLKRFVVRFSLLMLLLSFVLVPIVWWLAPSVILWLYGPNYIHASEVFRVLVIAVPIWLVSGVFCRTYLTACAARRLVWMQLASLVIMFISIYILYPRLGLVGFSYALIIERVFLLFSAIGFSSNNFNKVAV